MSLPQRAPITPTCPILNELNYIMVKNRFHGIRYATIYCGTWPPATVLYVMHIYSVCYDDAYVHFLNGIPNHVRSLIDKSKVSLSLRTAT